MGKNAEYIQRVMGYVEENVPVTQSILADRKAVCAEFLKNVQGKEFDKILLFGIGSSYNAGLMVKPLLESALQLDVLVASPAMYEQMCRSRSFDSALLIAASQSGQKRGYHRSGQRTEKTGRFCGRINRKPGVSFG